MKLRTGIFLASLAASLTAVMIFAPPEVLGGIGLFVAFIAVLVVTGTLF